MSLKNLLMAATGILGRGSFFQWCLAVSDALGGSSSGSVYPQFAYAKGIASQANIQNNVDLVFEGDGETNGITRASTDTWILTPGKVYLLSAGGYFDTFSNPTGGSVRIQWVDGNNNVLQSGTLDCPNAVFTPTTSTVAQSSAALVEIIYRCPDSLIGRAVKLRCTAATGTASKPTSVWWASLVEIPVAA